MKKRRLTTAGIQTIGASGDRVLEDLSKMCESVGQVVKELHATTRRTKKHICRATRALEEEHFYNRTLQSLLSDEQQQKDNFFAEVCDLENELEITELEKHGLQTDNDDLKKIIKTFDHKRLSTLEENNSKCLAVKRLLESPTSIPACSLSGQLNMLCQHVESIEETIGNEATKRSDGLCIVCRSTPSQYAILPCGHLCLCEECNESVIEKCPHCRTSIDGRVRIYKT